MQRHVLVAALALTGGVFAQSTFSSGTLVTNPGAGFGGADVSLLHPTNGTLGYTASAAANIRVADDFTVPCGESWTLATLSGFGYQTGSGTTSTLTAANYRIWSGRPGDAGSVVIHDYSTANQMTATSFTNIYRVGNGVALTTNTRPIMRADMNGNAIVLGPGQYWLDYTLTGSTTSGPFVPSVSDLANPITGDGMQFLPAGTGGTWTGPLLNGVSAVGIPIEVSYVVTTIPCYTYSLTQSVAGGAVTISNGGGPAFGVYLNLIALTPGATPNGWFAGLDIGVADLINELLVGAPFFGVLDASGAASFVVPAPIPSGLPLYTASIAYGAGNVEAGRVSAFTYTTL